MVRKYNKLIAIFPAGSYQCYAQYCFTSCNGIDLINGLTFSTDLDMTLIRACRDNCDQLIVLADHTKFGMTYYFKTLSIKEIDVLLLIRNQRKNGSLTAKRME